MTSKKNLVLWTGAVALLSLTSTFFCNFCMIIDDFWTNFSLAIMGSALLGFIMSLTEYSVKRKEALEQYYLTATNILNHYTNLDFFYTQEPIELLKAYYKELYDNLLKRVPSTHVKDKLYKYINKIAIQTVDIPEPEIRKYVIETLKNKINEYNANLQKVIEQYITISKIDLSKLESTYGNFNFIFSNKKLRKWIYREIHCPLCEFKSDIDQNAPHFRFFKQVQNGNISVMIDLIEEIQNNYFTLVDKSDDYMKTFIIYQTFVDDMNDKIEELRCRIFKQHYIPSEHYPLIQCSWMIKLKYPKLSV